MGTCKLFTAMINDESQYILIEKRQSNEQLVTTYAGKWAFTEHWKTRISITDSIPTLYRILVSQYVH